MTETILEGLHFVWNGAGGSDGVWRRYEGALLPRPRALPGVEEAVARLEAVGFAFADSRLSLSRTTVESRTGTNIEYGICGGIDMTRGEVLLVLRPVIAPPDAFARMLETLSPGRGEATDPGISDPDAVAAGCRLAIAEATHPGDPLPMGRGQKKAATEMANRIRAGCSDLLERVPEIVIDVQTRGGRGGWRRKVASLRFAGTGQVSVPAGPVPSLPDTNREDEVGPQPGVSTGP